MATFKERYWKYSLIIILIVLGIALFKHIIPYLGGLLGAITIYALVRKQMKKLTQKRKMKRGYAATLITLEVIFLCLIPLSILVWIIIGQVENLNLDTTALISQLDKCILFIKAKTGYDVLGSDTMSYIVSIIPDIIQTVMGEISTFAIDLLVIIFVLYFMLIGGEDMESYIKDLLPFNAPNKTHVIKEIDLIIRSNAIGIPLVAVIQGSIATVGYLIFGVHDVILVGLLTCVATVIPVVGTALVWVPISLVMAFNGHWISAVGIMAYGVLVVAQSDNYIRLVLQKKMADIHPLITIFGVVIGIEMFGFMGIIFGPLFLSLFMLFLNMFKQEYLDRTINNSDTDSPLPKE